MGYCGYLSLRLLRWQRRQDEVQIASQAFAHSYAWAFGGVAAGLLLMVTPVMNWLVDLVNTTANVPRIGSPDMANYTAVRLAFFYGLAVTLLMQSVVIVVASVIWWRRMGGLGKQS
jgi:hypothetical protein